MKVGVIGAGTMGNGIAHVFAMHGYSVILVDINSTILDNAVSIIKQNLTRQFNKQLISKDTIELTTKNIKVSNNIESLKSCNLVVEAIKEDLNLKGEIFQKLDLICDQKTIIASNTSSISINSLANYTNRADKIIGMHFMNPVPVMNLVEIINGDKTSRNTANFIINLSKDLGKIPVECNDSPGFVSNRILMPMINEAVHCFDQGVASIESIDSIMKLGMGHPMGPLKLADLIGLDVCLFILNVLFDSFKDKKYKPSKLLVKMVKENKLGKKSGEGFYKYEF
tara:strand:- start:1000 stop:1845 length:846 start_codon:yes stop_codon:yes gene_type:complete